MKQATLTKIRQVHNSALLDLVSRLGYGTNGIIHLLLGTTIIAIALGRSREADASGVLSPFAHSWYGNILLGLIFCGLFSLSMWYIIGVSLVRKTRKRNDWKYLVSHTARSLAYMVLALTTFNILINAGKTKSSAAESVDLTNGILRLPLGTFIVFAVAIVAAIIGTIFIYRGIFKRFLDSVKLPTNTVGNIIALLGVAGYICKGIILLLVAYIFFIAGVMRNPDKASGLDGALRLILTVPMGKIIVIFLGVGLIAYSGYSLARGFYSRQELN